MDVDLAQLRALAAIVDEGSFDAAADRLHLTPSAVSQRIKALEQTAGRVLVRRGRPAATTQAGAAYLRLARQVDALVQQARHDSLEERDDASWATVPLAVTADALDTWALPALAEVGDGIALDLHREDQERTAALLRSGTVMAAITAQDAPVQGCRSTHLGAMRYRPMAAPAVAARWFGGSATAWAEAPVVVYDRDDDLQDRHLRLRAPGARPPRHHVPASGAFVEAVVLGLGWGMLPDQQTSVHERDGRLVEIDPGHHVDVDLFWQQWTLDTPALDAVAAAIRVGAARSLRPRGSRDADRA